jgi:hypothetical protein
MEEREDERERDGLKANVEGANEKRSSEKIFNPVNITLSLLFLG